MTRLVVLFVLAIVIGSPIAAQAADRTSLLLAELDRCDPREPASYAPKLGILLALADGRSARELGRLIGGPRPCIGRVTSFGEGADELVFVGGGNGATARFCGSTGATGASRLCRLATGRARTRSDATVTLASSSPA